MKGKVTKTGYKKNSLDVNNDYNIIPSGRITMKDVDFPVFGIDEYGNAQMMYPGGEYQFPGNQVFELPMAQLGGMRRGKVDRILNENRDLNFVQRMYQPGTPSIMIPGQDGPSTHFMESADGFVYPTVVQMPDGNLQYLGEGAYDHAMQTGEYIQFPNDRQARRFAKSYKKGTGVLEEYGKGGLTQWFAEKWVDVKTGEECGRSGKDKDGRPYPACRPSKRVNETTPKTASEMSSSEKAKFKREKTSGKRINYNHERKQQGGQMSGSLGYDSMYGSPTTAFRYMMNPQDDSKYYGEVFGTKQGPGIAAGLDYDNQKYGTQGMIRLGLDPLRGASIRAEGGKRFNPIDNRREELSWGPYGGVNWQTNDYMTGVDVELPYNNIRPRLTAGVNAQYNRELANRGRFSIEGDLGVGIGDKFADMGKFLPEPYAAIKATYSPPMYRNTRKRRPSPTTYSSGYQLGGDIPQAQDGTQVEPTSWTDYLNPMNWGVPNMDEAGDFKQAFRAARNAGENEFMWYGKRYSTELAPKQEPKSKGLSNDEFLYRQAYQESRFNPNAKSPAGYSGLTQIGEGIISDYQKATGDTRSNPFDPAFAITVQKWAMNRYLNEIPWIKGTDDVKRAKALATYNWGYGNTLKTLEKLKADGVDIYNSLDWMNALPKETQTYINHIMGLDYSDEPDWEKSYNAAKEKSPYGKYYREAGGEVFGYPDYSEYPTYVNAWKAARRALGPNQNFKYGGKVRSTSTPNGY